MENRLEHLKSKYDLVVVGAGPGGSATAITAARTGLSVLQLDAKSFPRHKVCGGCLNPVTIQLLRTLMGDCKTWQCDSISLDSFLLAHKGKQFSARAELGVAVDRAQLDKSLVVIGIGQGVDFRDSVKAVVGESTGDHRVIKLFFGAHTTQIQASVAVVATGLGTLAVSGDSGLYRTSNKRSRVGIESIFDNQTGGYPDGRLTMAVARNGYVGLTGIPGGRLHIAASVDRLVLKRIGPRELVRRILEESGKFSVAGDLRVWRGTPPLTSSANCVGRERLFLVGDAASYVEPFTGEGIRWALESGIGVVPFVLKAVDGWKESYKQEWEDWYQRNIRLEQRTCRGISAGLKLPIARWIAHQAISIRPKFVLDFISRIHTH